MSKNIKLRKKENDKYLEIKDKIIKLFDYNKKKYKDRNTHMYKKCPKCKQKGEKNFKRLRRVTGYLTGDYKSRFNKGKQSEVEDRVKHGKNY